MAIWVNEHAPGGTPSLLARLRRAVEAGGYGHLFMQCARRLAAPLAEFGAVEFYVRALDAGLPPLQALDGVEVRVAAPDDLPAVLAARGAGKTRAELDRRVARGDRCVIAVDAQGGVLHSRWVARRHTPIPELGVHIVPGPDEAYFYDGYTRADARGRGVDGLVRGFVFHLLRDDGCRRVFSYVRSDNPVGRRAAARAQTRVGRCGYLRLRHGAPRLLYRRGGDLPALLDPLAVERRDEDQRQRALAWRRWFEGWLDAPPTRHSTGYSELPPAYFDSAARYVVDMLELDPAVDEVLDVGCASGMLSRRIAPYTRRFVGVDLIAGLLDAIPPGAVVAACGVPATFVAADARRLPLADGEFTKVYCTGVIHTLPSIDHGLAVIDELIRVCRPGGLVHVGAVPDAAKRWRGRWHAFLEAGLVGKLRIAAASLAPRWVRQAAREALRLPRRDAMAFLEYDLHAVRRRLERRGCRCEVLDFPRDYWSSDFRRTRSSLLIHVPAA